MSADPSSPRVVDYLCNGFTPDRQAVWDGALGASDVAVKIRDLTATLRAREGKR